MFYILYQGAWEKSLLGFSSSSPGLLMTLCAGERAAHFPGNQSVITFYDFGEALR